MEKKNILLYSILALIAFVVIIGLVNSFKTSNNLKNAINSLNEAKLKVDESMVILRNQELAIDSIKQTNNNLLYAMDALKTQNQQLRDNMTWRINRANNYLDSIKLYIRSKKYNPGGDIQ